MSFRTVKLCNVLSNKSILCIISNSINALHQNGLLCSETRVTIQNGHCGHTQKKMRTLRFWRENVRIQRNTVIEQTVGNVVARVKRNIGERQREIQCYLSARWPSWLDVLSVNVETRVLTFRCACVCGYNTSTQNGAVEIKCHSEHTQAHISYAKKSPHRLEVTVQSS